MYIYTDMNKYKERILVIIYISYEYIKSFGIRLKMHKLFLILSYSNYI